MLDKLSFTAIIKAHFGTLRNYGSGRTSPIDVATFTLLPALIAVSSIYPGFHLSGEALKAVAIPVLVLTLAPAALLKTVYSIASSFDCHRTQSRIEREFIRELVANIFYAILMGSLFGLTTLASLLFQSLAVLRVGLEYLLLFLAASFFLTLLMVLRRTHVLISKSCSGEDT